MLSMRTPVALKIALAIAGPVGTIGCSSMPRAPNGPSSCGASNGAAVEHGFDGAAGQYAHHRGAVARACPDVAYRPRDRSGQFGRRPDTGRRLVRLQGGLGLAGAQGRWPDGAERDPPATTTGWGRRSVFCHRHDRNVSQFCLS